MTSWLRQKLPSNPRILSIRTPSILVHWFIVSSSIGPQEYLRTLLRGRIESPCCRKSPCGVVARLTLANPCAQFIPRVQIPVAVLNWRQVALLQQQLPRRTGRGSLLWEHEVRGPHDLRSSGLWVCVGRLGTNVPSTKSSPTMAEYCEEDLLFASASDTFPAPNRDRQGLISSSWPLLSCSDTSSQFIKGTSAPSLRTRV